MLDSLAAASAAFSAALERRQQLDKAAADAAAKLADASKHRETLIARIAGGENFTAADHKKAEQSVRDAESISAVATAAAEYGRCVFEEAQRVYLQAQADDIDSRYAAVVDQHIEAARELDRRLALAREAAADMVAVDQRRRDIVGEARAHAGRVAQLSQSTAGLGQNRVIGSLRPGEWPVCRKAAGQYAGQMPSLQVELVSKKSGFRPEFIGFYEHVEKLDAEALTRTAHGLSPVNPTPTAPALPSQQQAKEDELRAAKALGADAVYEIDAVQEKQVVGAKAA